MRGRRCVCSTTSLDCRFKVKTVILKPNQVYSIEYHRFQLNDYFPPCLIPIYWHLLWSHISKTMTTIHKMYVKHLPLIIKPLRPLNTLFYAFSSQLIELKIPLNNKTINMHNTME